MENYLKSELLKGSERTYKGINKLTGESVAIKILPINQDIQKDAVILKQLNSLFLVKVNDLYVTETQIIIVQEFVENGSLRPLAGILNQGLVSKIVSQVFLGLLFLAENSIVHGGISLDNVLFTKDSQVKLQLIGRKREKTPESESNQVPTTKDDIFLLAQFVYELITGDSIEIQKDLVSYDSDFRITPDIQKFLDKCFKIQPNQRPSLQELKSSDKWIRIILGLDVEVVAKPVQAIPVTVDNQDSSENWEIPMQPLSFPKLANQIQTNFDDDSDLEQPIQPQSSPDNQSPIFPQIFQITQNQKQASILDTNDDSDDFNFGRLNQPLAIKTVIDNTFLNSTKLKNNQIDDFDDDDNDFNLTMQAPLKLQLKIEDELDDMDSDFQVDEPANFSLTKNFSSKTSNTVTTPKVLPVSKSKLYPAMGSTSNFFSDDEEDDFSFAQGKITAQKVNFKELTLNVQSISKFVNMDDLNDELEEQSLDDIDSNLQVLEFHSLRITHINNKTMASFSDDGQDTYIDFNEINSVQYFNDIIKHITTEKVQQLCCVLHQRIYLPQFTKFNDQNIQKALEQTNFSYYLLQQLNQFSKITLELQFQIFRLITLLIYSSGQFALSLIFQRHIFYQLEYVNATTETLSFQLQEFVKNDLFNKLNQFEKFYVVKCNFLQSVLEFLVMEDKNFNSITQLGFDIFLRQDGIFAISQIILCFGNKNIFTDDILLQISSLGCSMLLSLYKPFSDFKTEIVSQLIKNEENKQIVYDLLTIIFEFLSTNVNDVTETQHKLLQNFFDIIVDIFYNIKDNQILSDDALLDKLNQILQVPNIAILCPNEFTQMLNIVLLLSKIKDDSLQNNILRLFYNQFIEILTQNTESRNNLQTILLSLVNFVFGSDIRRKKLSTNEFLLTLTYIVKRKDFLWQFAQTLLLELLKSPPLEFQEQLLHPLSHCCAEGLSQPIWAKQSADFLVKFQIDFPSPSLEKADFSNVPDVALSSFASLFQKLPILSKNIFNKSMQKRTYQALNGSLSNKLSALEILKNGKRSLKHAEIKKFQKVIKQLQNSKNVILRRAADELAIDLMKVE